MERMGIDVSHHNGTINWQKVKADGVDFAIIKIGNGSKKNTPSIDSRFGENVKGAIEAGVPIGGYVASYAMEAEHARQEAAFFSQLLEGYKGIFSYPIFYDMEGEGAGGFYDQWPLGKEVISDICAAFCADMTAAGWLCGIYVNENWRKNRIRDELQTKYPLWLAHYASKPSYTGEIGIWQKSASGSVAGISGNVNMNVGYVDYPAFIYGAGLNGYAPDGSVPDGIIPEDSDSIPEEETGQDGAVEHSIFNDMKIIVEFSEEDRELIRALIRAMPGYQGGV